MDKDRNRVCPVELAGSLDSKIRRLLQNPVKILSPFVKENMRVLDIGCGPGFFSIELAKMIGIEGKVFAADLQQGMLDKLESKIKGTPLEPKISLIKCSKNAWDISGKFDFILAFYMIHEVPDKNNFFKSVKNMLDKNGTFLIVEPTLFHVSKKDFAATLNIAEEAGFKISKGPKLAFSLSAVLKNA